MIKLDDFLKTIQASADSIVQTIMDKNLALLGHYFEEAPLEEGASENEKGIKTAIGSLPLQPKMVALKYPRQTADGPVDHLVYVPLIALSPMSQLQMDSLEFNMEIDIHQEGNDIQISFPLKEKAGFFKKAPDKKRTTTAEVKLTVKGFDQPQGLSIVLDGYNKAIKAQMPD